MALSGAFIHTVEKFMCVLKMLDFVRCSRRLCGGEDVTFCCGRK